MDFQDWLSQSQQRAKQVLARVMQEVAAEKRLADAMRYAVLAGGKRLRPVLAYAAAATISKPSAATDIAACAVECIHAYSLIHDDLPAMDDDVLRRGQPTCHVKFDEATAILAGDALQTLAFELLITAELPMCSDTVRLRMLQELARASGGFGMVGGQAIDMAVTGTDPGEATLSRMHSLKTGALIRASILLGALSTGRATGEQLLALRHFAGAAGLAFQIQDDILDVEAPSNQSGKEQGKDQRQHKATYVSMLGLDGAKSRLREVNEQAQAALQGFDAKADPLRQLARHLAERTA